MLTEDTDTHIRVHKSTHDKLRKLGSMGESYNQVILRLIDAFENNNKKVMEVAVD